jgi:hypothetical protein
MAAPPRGAGRQRRNGNDPEIHVVFWINRAWAWRWLIEVKSRSA